MSATATVNIMIADVNDNAPRITSPHQSANVLQISPREEIGQTLIRIQAEDRDFGFNSRLHYSLAGSASDGLFSINSLTGEVSVQQSLDSREGERHAVMVIVRDGGEPSLDANYTLHIFINASVAVLPGKRFSNLALIASISHHELIIVLLAAGTLVVVIVLIAAIVCTKRAQTRNLHYKYDYRQSCDVSGKQQSHDGGLCSLLDAKTPDVVAWQGQGDTRAWQGQGDASVRTLHRVKAQTLPNCYNLVKAPEIGTMIPSHYDAEVSCV